MQNKSTLIVVNARFVTQELSGVQRFASEIALKLKFLFDDIVFVSPKDIIQQDLAKSLSVKTDLPFSFLKGHLWEQISLPFYLASQKFKTLLISLCNTGPILIRSQIYTLHDIGFKIYPQWYSKFFSKVYNIMVPILLKKSSHIITVSETSKSRIANAFKIDKRKISVVYNAVDFRPKRIKAKSKLVGNQYILSVSSFNPRKNLKKLIEAFILLDDDNMYLYLVGKFNKNFQIEEFENHQRILFLSDISDDTLIDLYDNASLFVNSSFYEGFGIPILEAMKFNLNICASDINSFNEIFENSILYFDPTSIKSIKESIEKGLKLPVKSNDYDTILDKYTWDNSAEKLRKIIIKILDK